MTFDLTYEFEPGTDADGVTVHIPLLVLNQVTADGFEWSVPGFREELVTTLIKSLAEGDPAQLRARAGPRPAGAPPPRPGLRPAHRRAGPRAAGAARTW